MTVAITRARVDPNKALEMIDVLVGELGADVNQILLWKNPEQSGNNDSERKFTPLLWAVFQNQPEAVEALLKRGADPEFVGCCLNKNKAWICGDALSLASQNNSNDKILDLLRNWQERKNRPGKNKTVIQIGGKSDWKSLIETKNARDKSDTDSCSSGWGSDISELISNPDYLSPEEIEAERREIRRRTELLEARIKVSADIEERISQLKFRSSSVSEDGQTSRESSIGPDCEMTCSIRI